MTRLLGADRQNNIWASVHPSGSEHSILMKIDGETQSIHPFTKQQGYDELTDVNIPAFYFGGHVPYSAFHAEEDGSVWIGANDRLLHINENDSITTFGNQTPGFPNAAVRHILDRNQELWIATNDGIISYQKQTGKFQPIAAPDSLQQNPVGYLYQDQENNIWVTAPTRMYRYNDQTQSFTLIDNPGLSSIIPKVIK